MNMMYERSEIKRRIRKASGNHFGIARYAITRCYLPDGSLDLERACGLMARLYREYRETRDNESA